MFDSNDFGKEINRMKAETLGDYGRRVEITFHMLHKERRLLVRHERILLRLQRCISGKCGYFRRRHLRELEERLVKKIDRHKKTIHQLDILKDQYMDTFKGQREALGMLDHSFVDDFYARLEKEIDEQD